MQKAVQRLGGVREIEKKTTDIEKPLMAHRKPKHVHNTRKRQQKIITRVSFRKGEAELARHTHASAPRLFAPPPV